MRILGRAAAGRGNAIGGRGVRRWSGRAIGRMVSTGWIRHSYLLSKALSAKYVHPWAPRLHEAVFVKLKGRLRRRYLRDLATRHGAGIDGSSRLYANAAKGRDYRPKVSVIVPNFRHARFLRERLDSIYAQTYSNFEVILLDDASDDGSRAILEEYAARHPAITRCCFNDANSGAAFLQWRRGLAMATGELVWIAESDDACSDDFLAGVVPPMANEAVMLSYCRTVFVEGESGRQIWSIEEYLADIDRQLWTKPFTLSAHQLVNKAWAVKNIVPNVSSAVFRHPGGLALLGDDSWARMRICGDWVFYLHLVRGGLVAYTPSATNRYRIHNANTSVDTYARDVYYVEHERVARELLSLYRLQPEVLEHAREALERHWLIHRPNDSVASLAALYDLDRARAEAAPRLPNLMMAGFALIAGGGETFPIRLANLMKAAGYGVTFLNCGHDETEPGVRSMLRADVPLLELDELHKLEVVVEDMGIEILHSHHAWVDATLCALLESNRDAKLVVTTHGMYEAMPAATLADTLPLIDARVDFLVYIADKNLQPFDRRRFGPERIAKIGNAVDVVPVAPVDRAGLGIGPDDFVLCLVSRAIPDKGWQEAIDAVRRASAGASRAIHLVLVGDGEECARLRASVADPRIHFIGFRANVRDYFAMADLGLLPSRFRGESAPLVVIECLHAGRPVLASNIGEIAAMLDTEDGPAGTLFDLDDWRIPVESLAALIRRHADDRDYHAMCAGRVAAAASRFDPVALQRDYAAVYQRVLGAAGSAPACVEPLRGDPRDAPDVRTMEIAR